MELIHQDVNWRLDAWSNGLLQVGNQLLELQHQLLGFIGLWPIVLSKKLSDVHRRQWFLPAIAMRDHGASQSSPLLLPVLALRWDRYPPLLFECTWRARLAFDPAVDLFQGCHIVVKLQETEHVWRSISALRLRLQYLLFADVPICSRLQLQHVHHPHDDLPFTFSLAQMAWDVESWLQQVSNSRELIQNITMDDMPLQTLQDGLIQVLVQRLDLGHGQVAVQAWQLLFTLHLIQGTTKSSVRVRTWEWSIAHEVHLRRRHQAIGLLTQLLVEVQNITHLADLTTDCFAQLTVRPPNLTDVWEQLVAGCWGNAKAIPVPRMDPNFLRWYPLHFAQLMIVQAWHQLMCCLNQLTLMLQACFNFLLRLLGDRHLADVKSNTLSLTTLKRAKFFSPASNSNMICHGNSASYLEYSPAYENHDHQCIYSQTFANQHNTQHNENLCLQEKRLQHQIAAFFDDEFSGHCLMLLFAIFSWLSKTNETPNQSQARSNSLGAPLRSKPWRSKLARWRTVAVTCAPRACSDVVTTSIGKKTWCIKKLARWLPSMLAI